MNISIRHSKSNFAHVPLIDKCCCSIIREMILDFFPFMVVINVEVSYKKMQKNQILKGKQTTKIPPPKKNHL